MKKEELIRYRAGLAALLVSASMVLSGCKAAGNGFDFKRGEDNSYVALEDSYINNDCIDKCYVVEAYNKITEETELFKNDEKIIRRLFVKPISLKESKEIQQKSQFKIEFATIIPTIKTK